MVEKIEPGESPPTTSGTSRTRSSSRSTRWCCARSGSRMTSFTVSSGPTQRRSSARDRAAPRDRRRGGAADARGLHFRRPPPGTRDRLGESGDAAAVHPERRLWGGTTNRDFEDNSRTAATSRRCRTSSSPRSAAATSDGVAGAGRYRRVKIVVAVKQVAKLDDEFELRADRPGSTRLPRLRAQRVGQLLRGGGALDPRGVDGDGEVVVVSVGDEESEEGMRTCLAMGADRGVRVWDPSLEGADALAVARVLAAAAEREHPDLVLCGVQSSDAVTAQPASRWPLISGGHTWLS